MRKKVSEKAYYQRLQELAEVNKKPIKESRTLGTLIDYKRAADGIAYGIVKENHNYYIKKAGTKENPDVADFAYIGGLANITEYQYGKLSEADKQRNMIFHTINEAVSLKQSKTGNKVTGKKRLNEDKAGDEIEMAASKVGDLDAATDATEVPVNEPAPEGGEEMPEVPTDEPEGGEEIPEVPAEEPAPEGGEEDKGLTVKELEKSLGKITNVIRKTELEPSQTKSYINSFISAFKDKLPELEIEERKEMADRLIKITKPEEIEDLGSSVEQEPVGDGVEEDVCAECGGFPQYAESRGYGNPEAFMECGDEEKASVISGYANAHNDGQNDGDFKMVALLVTPEMLEKLKGDYGHDEYAEKLTPYTNELNETTEEDKLAQINELWGGLGSLAKGAWGGVKQGAQAVGGAVKSAGQAIGQAAQNVKQTYYKGEINPAVKKVETDAATLGKQIANLNNTLTKAGQQPINVKSILATIQNQLGAGGAANLGKFKYAAEGVVDAGNVEVQPNMLKEDDEPEIESGEIENNDKGDDKKDITFAPPAQNLGVGMIKPDGAPTTGVDITVQPDKTVNIAMNESEKRVRKYIHNRLEELSGLKKPSLNENKKSNTLKKLDAMIAEQFKLYESTILKKRTK